MATIEQSRTCSVRKGLYGNYHAHEVLDGWRRQQLARGPDKVGPKGYERPGKSDTPNVTLLMWCHVEGFFQSRDDIRRRVLLEANEYSPRYRCAICDFEVWAKNNPFTLRNTPSSPDSGGTTAASDLEVVPLTQACRELGIKPNTVTQAERRGASLSWQPKGSPKLTTRATLAAWFGSGEQKA